MSDKAFHSHDDDDFDYEDEHIERESDKQEYEALDEGEFNSQPAPDTEPRLTPLPSLLTLAPGQGDQKTSMATVSPAHRQDKSRTGTKAGGTLAVRPSTPQPSLTFGPATAENPAKKPSPAPSNLKNPASKALSDKPNQRAVKSKSTGAGKKRTGTSKVSKTSVRGKTSSNVASHKKSSSGHRKSAK